MVVPTPPTHPLTEPGLTDPHTHGLIRCVSRNTLRYLRQGLDATGPTVEHSRM